MGVLAMLICLFATACSPGTGSTEGSDAVDDALVTYERLWPDGYTEREVIGNDGRVSMWHGESLERLTLSPEDMGRISDALDGDIPIGSPEDSPERTLTLADGAVIKYPRPESGSITELMDRLMDTHSLG